MTSKEARVEMIAKEILDRQAQIVGLANRDLGPLDMSGRMRERSPRSAQADAGFDLARLILHGE